MTVTWRSEALRRWPDAERVHGDGPVALLARCPAVDHPLAEPCTTIWLLPSPAAALDARALLDEGGCGGACRGRHEIVGLAGQDDVR